MEPLYSRDYGAALEGLQEQTQNVFTRRCGRTNWFFFCARCGGFLRKAISFAKTARDRQDATGPKKMWSLLLVRYEKVSVRVDCRNQTASYDWK